MKYFVTGGAGFIGSNFIHYVLENFDGAKVLNYDLLTYAGNLENVKKWEGDERYSFSRGDIGDYQKLMELFKVWKPDVVVNFAAESHNDKSEINPRVFFETNVLGTEILLEAVRDAGIPRFHHISTCEVFGDLPVEEYIEITGGAGMTGNTQKNKVRPFTEESRYNPKTPYNASKAGSDHVCSAFYHTFKVPITVSNCANNYGPYQYPEKVLPLFITNALDGIKMPLFKSSGNKREWTHVADHCAAIDLIIKNGKPGEFYNIGSWVEKTVEDIADAVINSLSSVGVLKDNKMEDLKNYIPDRLQHDRRYLLDSSKVKKELGWAPKINFEEGILQTVKWYVENESWWRPIKSGEQFKKYYEERYKTRNNNS